MSAERRLPVPTPYNVLFRETSRSVPSPRDSRPQGGRKNSVRRRLAVGLAALVAAVLVALVAPSIAMVAAGLAVVAICSLIPPQTRKMGAILLRIRRGDPWSMFDRVASLVVLALILVVASSKASSWRTAIAEREQARAQQESESAARTASANRQVQDLVVEARDAFRVGDTERALVLIRTGMDVPHATDTSALRTLAQEIAGAQTDAANGKVVRLVAEARSAWDRGDDQEYRTLLDAALAVSEATDLSPALELRVHVGDARVAALIDAADEAAVAGDIDRARRFASEARLVIHASEHGAVTRFEDALSLLANDADLRFKLLWLPAEEFDLLEYDRQLPESLSSGQPSLDAALLEAAMRHVPTLATARSIDAEQKAAEEEARRARIAKAEAERRRSELIESGFSSFDGRHIQLCAVVRRTMHDDGSFEHVETRSSDMGDYLLLAMDYRGRNQFGAKVLERVYARASLAGAVLEILDEDQMRALLQQ